MLPGEFSYRGGVLSCEDAPLSAIAQTYGTPAYVYSKRGIVERFQAYEQALAGIPHRVCFAVKSNSNLAVLQTLAREGAGFDIVSGGELFRVLAAGGVPSSIIFSGVGKTDSEIRYAIETGIHSFNCESEAEIGLISQIASALGRQVSIAIRVNPDVDAATHPYISTGLREHKFGIGIQHAEDLYLRAASLPGIAVDGASCHIGSQLLEIGPLLEAADRMLQLVSRLRAAGLPIRNLDLGGGLGIAYRPDERGACVQNFIAVLREKIAPFHLTLIVEPGRSISGEAGVLLTRVLLVKRSGAKMFVVVDAAMNDLIRPALYQAHHEILAVEQSRERERMEADVVGPVCETGDFFARGRNLASVLAGDLLAIQTAGAYGFVLSSNYNSRPRPCELLVDGEHVHLARRRESYDDLIRGETGS
ncbi:MAG: diaminopimelate decarboxylase [Bryobacteraceae bacterium]